MQYKKQYKKAFTLIELLIVLAIIGILASVILASLGGGRTKAREAKARAEIGQMVRVVQLAQLENVSTLEDVTGHDCSSCECRSGDMRNIPSTHVCAVRWQSARDALAAEVGGSTSLAGLDRDPWGSPYMLDENEGEFSYDPCIRDTILSYGPDGVYDTGGGPDDNIWFYVPFGEKLGC